MVLPIEITLKTLDVDVRFESFDAGCRLLFAPLSLEMVYSTYSIVCSRDCMSSDTVVPGVDCPPYTSDIYSLIDIAVFPAECRCFFVLLVLTTHT